MSQTDVFEKQRIPKPDLQVEEGTICVHIECKEKATLQCCYCERGNCSGHSTACDLCGHVVCVKCAFHPTPNTNHCPKCSLGE